MTTHRGSFDGGDNLSDINAVDRLLDRLGEGRTTPADFPGDPLLGLLSSARQESDADLPSPPNLAELLWSAEEDVATEDLATGATVTELFPAARVKVQESAESAESVAETSGGSAGPVRKILGRGVAIGGVSVSMTVLAGGIAAALAVGGAGLATYQITRSAPVEAPASEEQTDGTDPAVDGAVDAPVDTDPAQGASGKAGESTTQGQDGKDSKDKNTDKATESPKDEPGAEPRTSETPTESGSETPTESLGNTEPPEAPVEPAPEPSVGEPVDEVATDGAYVGDAEPAAPVDAVEPVPQSAPQGGQQSRSEGLLSENAGPRLNLNSPDQLVEIIPEALRTGGQ